MRNPFSYAQLLLKFRPRSVGEIRYRLKIKGYSENEINETIDKLKRAELLDDIEFARYWFTLRKDIRPKGRNFIIRELKFKKISDDIIEKVFKENSNYDERKIAYNLAKKRYELIKNKEEENKLKIKLYSFLQRRGFNSEICRDIIKEIIKNEN
jgi:regulatory protein